MQFNVENLPDIDFPAILESYYGLTLEPMGRDKYRTICPFHGDAVPSFMVWGSDDRGVGNFHCFGCGSNGNVIHFVQRMEKLDFQQALKFIGDNFFKKNNYKILSKKPACSLTEKYIEDIWLSINKNLKSCKDVETADSIFGIGDLLFTISKYAKYSDFCLENGGEILKLSIQIGVKDEQEEK